MSKRAYVKNIGYIDPASGQKMYQLRVECGGRDIIFMPDHLTEVSEDEAKVVQFNYAHMGLHHVSFEEASAVGGLTMAPKEVTPPVTPLEALREIRDATETEVADAAEVDDAAEDAADDEAEDRAAEVADVPKKKSKKTH